MLVDANARTGEKIEGERTEDGGVLVAYGRDEFNDNGKRLLNFATNNKLAVTNMFLSARAEATSRTPTTASSGIEVATSSASTTTS